MYTFAARDVKKVLRAIREYIPPERMVKSLSAWQVLKRNITYLIKKKK